MFRVIHPEYLRFLLIYPESLIALKKEKTDPVFIFLLIRMYEVNLPDGINIVLIVNAAGCTLLIRLWHFKRGIRVSGGVVSYPYFAPLVLFVVYCSQSQLLFCH